MQYGINLYGQYVYGNNRPDETEQEQFIDLVSLLPDYYQGIREMGELQTVLGHDVGELAYRTNDILNQCYISTAAWGLERWEKLFGSTTDKSKTYERRREILLAKLRGSGTTTKEMIKNVARAFSGGEVNVIEDPKENRFEVQFIGIKGIPQNMPGLINAIEEIKPAHLAYGFKYTYTVWSQVIMTWNAAKNKSWGELRTYEGE